MHRQTMIYFLLSTLMLSADNAFDRWLSAQKTIVGNLEKIVATTQREDAVADLSYLKKRIAEEVQAEATRPDLDSMRIFRVSEEGIPCDGRSDVSLAVQNLVERVKKLAGGARIAFPAGNFRFKTLNDDAHLFVKGARNLRIEGTAGTRFIFENPQSNGIFVADSERVELVSLTITYDPLPYTFGRISAVDKRGFSFHPAPGATSPDLAHFGRCSYKGLVRFFSGDTIPGTVLPRRIDSVPFLMGAGRPIRQPDGSYRFDVPGADQRFASGFQMVLYARQFSHHAVQFDHTNRCRIHGVTLHASPGIGFLAIASAGLFITDCRIEPVPGSGSFTSTNADALFIRDAPLGGLIAGNHFSMMGDDYLNVHDIVHVARDVTGTILVAPKQSWRRADLVAGARLGWIRASRHEIGVSGWATIVSIQDMGDAFRVQLDRPLPADFVTERSRRPEHKRYDVFTFAANHAHGLAFLDNEFRDGSSRILLGGRNVLFAGNKIVDRRPNDTLFRLGVEGDWWANGLREGRPSSNLIIEDNDISMVGKMVFSLDARLPRPEKGFPAEYCSYSDWIIRNNRITLRAPLSKAMPLCTFVGTRNLEISGNLFYANTKIGKPAFAIKNCQNVVLQDNFIHHQAAECPDESSALRLSPKSWRVQHHIANVKRRERVLEASFTGDDPFVGIPLAKLSCAAYQLALFKLKVAPGAAEQAQLFWQPSGTSLYRMITFSIVADGAFHDYRIPLAQSPFWSGSISLLRLDPTTHPNAASGFSLKDFRLVPKVLKRTPGEEPKRIEAIINPVGMTKGPQEKRMAFEAWRWKVVHHLSDVKRSGSLLTAKFSGDDPFLGVALPKLSCEPYSQAVFRLKVMPGAVEQAQLFWQDEKTKRYFHITIPIVADGAFHDYRLELNKASGWKGTIGFLRLDPTIHPRHATGFELEDFHLQ